MKITIKICIVITLFFSLYSCSRYTIPNKETTFRKLFHIRDMNNSMRLETWLPEAINDLHLGTNIDLAVINESKNKILFPSNYGVRILNYDKKYNNWIEIPNGMAYIPYGMRQVSPKGEETEGIISVGVYPQIENSDNPIEIRVVIIGTTTYGFLPIHKKVGSYIDLTLQP